MAQSPICPELIIQKIKNPNRGWAIPILGGLAKIIILIPVFLELLVLFIYIFILQIINSFYVLFNKKYWDYCFNQSVGVFNLLTKTTFFFYGFTDNYPGFNLKLGKDFGLKFEMPKKPGIFFAIPLVGIIARGILIIPYAIYTQIIGNGARVGIVASSVPVLFNGRYPDSTFELGRDSVRLSLSQYAYFAGISDKYPSFKIDMDHQTIKIALIIIGTALLLLQWGNNHKQKKEIRNYQNPPFMQDYRPTTSQNQGYR